LTGTPIRAEKFLTGKLSMAAAPASRMLVLPSTKPNRDSVRMDSLLAAALDARKHSIVCAGSSQDILVSLQPSHADQRSHDALLRVMFLEPDTVSE
jgi:hypothetical protein